MNIVLVGSGDVGYSVAKGLSQDGHNLTLIESDDDRATKAENELDVMVVRGNGARPQILARAGVVKPSKIDLLIACTNKDEVNIMACWIAKRAGIKRVISRAIGLEFTDSKEWGNDLGIDLLISPERSVAREVEELLDVRYALQASEILSGKAAIYVFKMPQDSPACAIPLLELRKIHPKLSTLILYIIRDGKGFIPAAKDYLMPQDICYSICYRSQAHELEAAFMPNTGAQLRKVIIAGGGKVGFQVAQLMEKRGGVEVKLFERDKVKAKRLASELSKTGVIWGDAADEDLMNYEGIAQTDGFVAATESDENNLLLCVLARHLGAAKSIAIVKRKTYMKLSSLLPLDAVVNRNSALSEVIIRSVRYPEGSKVLTVLENIDAETLEITLPDTSPAIGMTLMELHLPKGVIVAMITRDDDIFIPSGMTKLKVHDTLVMFAHTEMMSQAVKVIGAS